MFELSSARCWCCLLDVKALSLSPLLIVINAVAEEEMREERSVGAQKAL